MNNLHLRFVAIADQLLACLRDKRRWDAEYQDLIALDRAMRKAFPDTAADLDLENCQ
jgi:hypothetical protein